MSLPQKVPNLRVVDRQRHLSGFISTTKRQTKGGVQNFGDRCRRRWRLFSGTVLFSFLVMGGYVLWHPEMYKASFRLLMEPVSEPQTPPMPPPREGIMGTLPADRLPTPFPQTDVGSQIVVLESDKVLAPIAQKLQQQYPHLTTRVLAEHLEIQPVVSSATGQAPTETKVLEVAYRDRQPEIVTAVLKAVAEAFVDYSQRDRQEQLNRTLKQLDNDINQHLAELEQLQRQLQASETQGTSLQPSEQLRFLTEQYRQIHSLRQAARLKAVEAYGRFQGFQEQLKMTPAEALAAANLSTSPAYQQQLARIQELDQEIARNLAIFREGTPIIQALEEQRRVLLEQLQAIARQVIGEQYPVNNPTALGFQGTVSQTLITNYITAWIEYENQRRYDAELAAPQAAIAQQLQQLSGQLPAIERLQNQIRRANLSLEMLNQARQAVQLQLAQNHFAWQVLTDVENPAVQPTFPRLLLLVLGAIASLLLGVFAVYLADAADHTFVSPAQVEETLGVPLLGNIPKATPQINLRLERVVKGNAGLWQVTQVLPTVGEGMKFQESFHHLLANLQAVGLGQSLAIISALPTDGRTTVALHLSLAAAGTGQRVLLIDGDLRQPKIHRYLGLSNEQGLADWLIQRRHWHSVAQTQRGLAILTAGELRQQPMRLLSQDTLKQFMAHLKNYFDLVIVDTPPLANFADAKLWSGLVDQTLVVVNLKAPRQSVGLALADYSLGSVSPLGVVVNLA
ncbi:chain length determinant protein-tyrosine kinase EpsG family [Thermosynechococcus sp. NK55a]|uniref:GumC family protein n=3 Tax=Thermosynechococcus TaxID=146785 RepID=UPI0003D8FCBE|nr:MULTISPECIES: polysaccharide biosynthesis tyrosine autokinase [unclassified Thermosynechococcus]AHB88411.1 chain length determinant protein-tyrosine kinase EpsG family [Thermosynechococcus sp. NK55a]HIK22774.1 AAA family ATPase [Thermosynechococcus sp. M3746_W2019_013]